MKRRNSSHLTRRDGYKVVLVVLLVPVAGFFFYREYARSRKPLPSILYEYHEELSYPEIMSIILQTARFSRRSFPPPLSAGSTWIPVVTDGS